MPVLTRVLDYDAKTNMHSYCVVADEYQFMFHFSGEMPKEQMRSVLAAHLDESEQNIALYLLNEPMSKDPASLAARLPGANQVVKHPVTGKDNLLHATIINLNDFHKWTREAIADWIETLDVVPVFEPKGEAAPMEAHVIMLKPIDGGTE